MSMYYTKKNDLLAKLQSATERLKQTSVLDKDGMVAVMEALYEVVDECVSGYTENDG